MSNATNLALLGLSGFGNAGNVLTSTGETTAPAFSASGVGVREIRVVNQVLSRLGINNSTGNVSVSGLPDISELDVPSWVNGGHISDWSTLQYYLSAVAATNTSPASAIYGERFGSVPSGFTSYSLTIVPNRKIYAFGSDAGGANTWVVVIDPNTNTVSSFGMPFDTTNAGIAQGVLAPNGKIYAIPYTDSIVRVIDPSNNSISSIGTIVGTFNNIKILGAVLAPNGKIYTVPYNSTVVQVIDPNASTIASFGTFPLNSTSSINANQPAFFNGAVLAPNGRIYGIPDSSSYFWVIDPSNNSITSIATFPVYAAGGNYCYKGAVAINGKIYTGPGSRSIVFLIDPDSNTVTALTTVNFSGYDMRLFPNGKLYMHGSNNAATATYFSVLDPDNNTITTGVTVAGYAGHLSAFGCVVHPNGKVYYGNINATQFLAITPLNNNKWNLNVCTNPLIQMGSPTG